MFAGPPSRRCTGSSAPRFAGHGGLESCSADRTTSSHGPAPPSPSLFAATHNLARSSVWQATAAVAGRDTGSASVWCQKAGSTFVVRGVQVVVLPLERLANVKIHSDGLDPNGELLTGMGNGLQSDGGRADCEFGTRPCRVRRAMLSCVPSRKWQRRQQQRRQQCWAAVP